MSHANHDHNHDHDHHGHDDHDDDHHGHHHGHGHSHAPADFGRAFAIGIALNAGFVLIEAFYGWAADSMALLADAGHNLSDVLGLVLAWVAATLAKRPPTTRYTYGLKSASILAALFNGVFLLVACGAIGWEAIQRLYEPPAVAGRTVMVVAAVGILVNGATALLFASGRRGDLNIRGAYLHMLGDAAVSAGVVVAGLAVLLTGQVWIDPLVSLLIVLVILWSAWGLTRESLTMLLQATPVEVDPTKVRAFLAGQPGVAGVHDLHVWPISTTDLALTAHLTMPGGHPGDGFLMAAADDLREKFRIGHVTLQIELDPDTPCALAPDDVV